MDRKHGGADVGQGRSYLAVFSLQGRRTADVMPALKVTSTMSIFHRRKKFVVNEPDPSYNVIYLGNVLTVMAKGEGCADKALALIWRTYCSRARPEIPMTLSITRSGLQGVTKHQGLTEYWAHRITHCTAPSDAYPRVFCWIYKHEGKKLKPELRCHAVLCKRPEFPRTIALLLHEKISSALRDYKREKIARQNVRLCPTLAGYPAPPQRKIMLSVGGQNFRPPMNRSKSAPRLHSILECGREGDELEDLDEESSDGLIDVLDETNSVSPYSAPGTPEGIGYGYRVDLELGKLRIDQRRISRKPNSIDAEADSISDESGYQDEKSSLEGEYDSVQDAATSGGEDTLHVTAL